jgi:hypothetical protein
MQVQRGPFAPDLPSHQQLTLSQCSTNPNRNQADSTLTLDSRSKHDDNKVIMVHCIRHQRVINALLSSCLHLESFSGGIS